MTTAKVRINRVKRLDGSFIDLVPVMVNGNKLGMVLLDTGAERTVLDAENIARWNLPVNREGFPVLVKSGGGYEFPAWPCKLESLHLGELVHVKDFEVLVADVFAPDEVLIAGVLGSDFLGLFESYSNDGHYLTLGLKK